MKTKSSFENHEAQLKEILGIKQEGFKMPTSLQDLQNFAKKPTEADTKEKLIQDLENMKLQDSEQKEKFLGSVIKEGGLLYRTQSGLLQPQIGKLYDQTLTKPKKPDLGAPSGRKEVQIIIAWLELMIQNHIYEINDLTLEEKLRRAQLIYTACYKEVIRQVSVHCLERGMLLQKIWNAQIDLHCLREDSRIKEIDAFKERVTNIIDRSLEETKEKLKGTEKLSEELKELLRVKDGEIEFLIMQMEEIKQKNEKERLVYVDVGFQRNRKKKNTRPHQKPSIKLTKTDQELKAFQEKQQSTESQTKLNIPTILLGFFDKDGLFHKQKTIQNNGDEINVNQFFDEIVLMNLTVNKYVMTDESIEADAGLNKITPQKPSISWVDKSQQFPESSNLRILRQSTVSVNIEKKEKQLSSDTNRHENEFSKYSINSGKYFHSKTRSELPKSNLETEIKIDSTFKSREKNELNTEKILKKNKTASHLKGLSNQSPGNEIIHSNDEAISLDSNEIQENEENTDNKDQEDLKREIKLRKKNVRTANKKDIASNQNRGSKDKSSNNFNSTSRRNQTTKKSTRSQRELADTISRPEFNKEIIKPILSKDNEDEMITSPLEEAKFIKSSANTAEDARNLSAPKQKQGNNKPEIKPGKYKTPNKTNEPKASKDINDKKEIIESASDKKIKSSRTKVIKKKLNNEVPIIHKKNNTTEKSEIKANNKILSRSSSSGSTHEKLELENPVSMNPSKKSLGLRKSEIVTIRKEVKPRSSVYMETIEDEYDARTEDKSCQVLINPIPFEDLTRSQILSSIQQLKNILEGISSDEKQKEDLLKDSRSRNRGLKLEKVLNSLFVIKEGHPVVVEIVRSDKACQTILELEDLTKIEQEDGKQVENFGKIYPEILKPRRNTDHGSDTEHFGTNQRKRTQTPLKSSIKSRTHISIDEFLLGQIFRKVIIAHPGQKLLNLVVESLCSNKNIQAQMTLSSLMKIISLVYSEKVSLYRDNSTYKKSEASMILYDFLMNMYGLKTVAENKFKQVVTSTIALRDKFIRIKNFSRFLGLEENYVVEDWNFYLNAFEVIEQVNIPFHFFHGVSYYSSLQRAVYCVHSIFDNKFSEGFIEEVIGEVNEIRIDESELDQKSLKVIDKYSDILNTDKLLYVLLRHYISLKMSIHEALFPQLSKDLIFNEAEYIDLLKNVMNHGIEYLSKLFDQHAVLKKDEDEKILKVIRLQSILSIIVDYSLIDLKKFTSRSP